ncbi:MAG: hypothetical protein J0I44_06430, partial [Microbacterium sp.]|nr:hypothetical protein [Microbacterium sp.]
RERPAGDQPTLLATVITFSILSGLLTYSFMGPNFIRFRKLWPMGTITRGYVLPLHPAPAIALLLIAGLVAGLWRGRRFGPLVSETLPVTVRAAETTEGRARLYARSRDAVHAADRLRVGALRRLARLLALGPAASADEISDAVADRVATPRAVVRDILIDGVPRSDRELVALSDRLRDLEAAVRAAVRSPGAVPAESERNRP